MPKQPDKHDTTFGSVLLQFLQGRSDGIASRLTAKQCDHRVVTGLKYIPNGGGIHLGKLQRLLIQLRFLVGGDSDQQRIFVCGGTLRNQETADEHHQQAIHGKEP
jgi:hypothetical protein